MSLAPLLHVFSTFTSLALLFLLHFHLFTACLQHEHLHVSTLRQPQVSIDLTPPAPSCLHHCLVSNTLYSFTPILHVHHNSTPQHLNVFSFLSTSTSITSLALSSLKLPHVCTLQQSITLTFFLFPALSRLTTTKHTKSNSTQLAHSSTTTIH